MARGEAGNADGMLISQEQPLMTESTFEQHMKPVSFVKPELSRSWLVLVCAASFMVNFIVDGILFSFGVFLLELLDYFGESKSKTSLVGSLLLGTSLMVGPCVSFLLDHFSCRQVVITGSILSSASFIAGIFSPNIETLIIFYGVFGGATMGLMYITSIIVVGLYFNERRALATGIAVSGSGFGTCAFSFLIDRLVVEYSWRGCILLLAGLLLQCSVCGVLFRPLVKNSNSRSGVWTGLLGKIRMLCVKKQNTRHGYSEGNTITTFGDQMTPMIVYNTATEVRLTHPSVSRLKSEDFLSNIRLSQSHDNINMKLQIPKRLCKSHDNMIDTATNIENSETIGAKIEQGYIHPIRRKDIFYSGSIMHLPEFQEAGGMDRFLARMASSVSEDRLNTSENNPGSKVSCVCPRGLLLLKDSQFILLLITMALWTGQATVMTFLPDLAVSRGISRQNATLLVSFAGLTNTFGRLAAGFLANTSRVHSVFLYACALLGSGCITAAIPLTESFGMLVFLSLGFGLCMGSYISLRTIVLVDILGIDTLTQSFGIVAVVQGICFTVSVPLSGAMYDQIQSFSPSFYTAAGLYALSGIISFAVLYFHKREERTQEITIHPNTNNNK